MSFVLKSKVDFPFMRFALPEQKLADEELRPLLRLLLA
jgi:hypothetical protein